MSTRSMMLSIIAALAAFGVAVPSPQVEPHCDSFYLVEKWGVTVTQASWNSSRIGSFKGCADSWKVKRDGTEDNPDTKVEITDETWASVYADGQDAPEEVLFGRAIAELCGDTFCDGEKQISVSSGASSSGGYGTELNLSLDGEFPDSDLRDDFFSLLKDAVRKSIDEQDKEILFTHIGSGFANGVTTYGDASGYSLTLRMGNSNSVGQDCPKTVNFINAAGSLVPELAPIFGYSAAVCASLG